MGYIPVVAVTLVFLILMQGSEMKPQNQPSSVACADQLSKSACQEIAMKGKCPENGLSLCKETCRLCPKPVACADLLSKSACQEIAMNGKCPENGLSLCKETCSLCPEPGSVEPAASNECGIRKLHPQNNNPMEAGLGEFPWMAHIIDVNGGPFYLGALISTDWIVTLARPYQNHSAQSLKVRVGALHTDPALDQLDEEVPVDQIIIHPQYNVKQLGSGWRTWNYNIALLRLGTSLSRDGRPHIAPVCLPSQGEIFTGQRCWVTGWNRATGTGVTNKQSVLQKESLPIWDPHDCERQIRKHPGTPQNLTLDKSSSLCAGGEAGKNICVGNGAPVVCEGGNGRYVLVGLDSWSMSIEDTCVKATNPVIYSNVPNLIDFIKEHTKI